MLTSPATEIENLQGRHDVAGVRAAMLQVCGRFGRVSNLTIFTVNHVDQPRAVCFIRMASAAEDQRIMASLGIGRFGGQLVVVVSLRIARELVASGD